MAVKSSRRILARVGVLAAVLGLRLAAIAAGAAEPQASGDYLRDLQTQAIAAGRADVGHWGADPKNYKEWGTHSNRLIPVYAFGTRGGGPGVDLDSYTGKNSPYRDAEKIKRLYGRLPAHTLNPAAEYCDQTNIFDLQRAAAASGRKYIFLVIFDGMDWQSTQAAAIYRARKVGYTEGRGAGLHFQDYTAGGTTQFGYMCTSPYSAGADVDVDQQTVVALKPPVFGGYDAEFGGPNPWTPGGDPQYLISKSRDKERVHAYTDSSCSASSMTAGIKSYNGAVNVDPAGHQVPTIAHWLQDKGYGVGAVSSVPISHATPAAAYAHNVERDDYQDLTRDMLGLKSVSHPQQPLPGLDIVIGGGYGDERQQDKAAGKNFVPGNVYLTAADLQAVDARNGGPYVTAVRTAGANGAERLLAAAREARDQHKRLLGFYGVGKFKGHLPFQTADGDYRPAPGRSGKAEEYSPADLSENPTLADMTRAALTALEGREKFWLMVEPGDVDWANHDNNLDNSIGAVFSGDAAVKVITDWVEQHSNWQESLLIVTADHGHYLHLVRPELLIPPAAK